MRPIDTTATRRLNAALWTVQVLLALLFLFAGGMKFVMPIAEMTKQMPMPGWFLRCLGVLEVAGALGLILPGLFHRRPQLTPLAAQGLVIIMSGATALTLQTSVAAAAGPFVIGILAGLVAYGRTRLPHRTTPASALAPAHLNPTVVAPASTPTSTLRRFA